MSTAPIAPVPSSEPSLLDKILAMLDGILTAASGVLPAAVYAELLLKIIQKGVGNYEAHTGEPIDSTLIRPIDLIGPDE